MSGDFTNKLKNFSGDWYLSPRDRLESRSSQDYHVHFDKDRNTPSEDSEVEFTYDKNARFHNYSRNFADDTKKNTPSEDSEVEFTYHKNVRFHNYSRNFADDKRKPCFQDYSGNFSEDRNTPLQNYNRNSNSRFKNYGGNISDVRTTPTKGDAMNFADNISPIDLTTQFHSVDIPKYEFYPDSIVIPRPCVYRDDHLPSNSALDSYRDNRCKNISDVHKGGYMPSKSSPRTNALLAEGISPSLCRFDSFRKFGQPKGDENKPDVTMEQRIVGNILRKNADFLSRHLVLSPSVLDRLHSAGIISDVARKQIIFEEQRKQVPMLLQHLEGHGLVTIRKFLEVLRETGHGWLVTTIMETEAMSYEDVSPQPTRRQPEISSTRYPRLLTPDWNRNPGVPLGDHKPPPSAPVYVSLGKLLDDRQRLQDDPKHVRGQLQPKVVLEDVMGRPLRFTKPNDATTFQENVPASLLNLQGYFKGQSITNEQTLSVLKQEEVAIRELLDQNVRDQAKLRRNQHALGDIDQRLDEIHARASDVYNPTTDAQLSRYRLAQLNQIPWRDEN